jgi:molybdopterin biosynthesis enzyme
MQTLARAVRDDAESIRVALLQMAEPCDALITSGGAWKGEQDLVIRVLDQLGWSKVYHKVRIGPGKAIGFGAWHDKPVSCLPGGPPSKQMALIQLTLPGLLELTPHPPGAIDWVALIGSGEPTLHSRLGRLICQVKESTVWPNRAIIELVVSGTGHEEAGSCPGYFQ